MMFRAKKNSHASHIFLARPTRVAFGVLAIASLAMASCEAVEDLIGLEDMSADKHREAANSHDEEARTHSETAVRYDQNPSLSQSSGDTADEHIYDADLHYQLSDAHEEAARLIEEVHENECGDVPANERGRCPFNGAFGKFQTTREGVVIQLNDAKKTEEFVSKMRCHQAHGRVLGFPTMQSCPLYLRSVIVGKSADGRPTISTADPTVTPPSQIQTAASSEPAAP